ncbi:MAG: response regulator transcription factor [Bacteroides sp.]|nr:response regulator transcription factor [Bacteroidales bacterium]MBD5326714.1 response regulator transcription factor [Bacteroides sp.]MDE6222903.1 hypothetical protein [Muribaculaceae bacterium]
MNETQKNKRALVATDDHSLPAVLTAMLAPTGIEVQCVDSQSMQPYAESGYTVVMVDGNPLGEVGQGLPAMVVISPDDPINAYDSGADLVIDKPLRTNVLLAKLRSVLRRYGVNI